ncbi:MAG: HxsD-like protein [Oscillospiraceae bacterium]|nr:HxsD-like protein [Oscillospiraceae bacterium]
MRTVKYNKSIYGSQKLFWKAIEAYSSLVSIRMSEDDQYYYCSFSDFKYEAELTINEFNNYVLLLMQKDVFVN